MGNLTSTTWSISQLMDSFQKGQIAVPEIQRDVVWDSDQIKELVNSIYHDYPCGSLILWEPRFKDEKLMREIIRPERLAYYDDQPPKYFLVDGQQRVTALASVILEHGFLKSVEPEIEQELASLYVQLKRFPEEVEAAYEGEPYKFPWVLINSIFSGAVKELPEYKEGLDADERTKIDRYVQHVRDYQFPVQIIQETDYPTVGKIFSLVNSQGTQLTGAEIHIASIIPYWQGISKEFREYRGDLSKNRYDLDLTFLMRAITVISCDVPQIKKLADKVSQRQLSKKQLNRFWNESKLAINAVNMTLRDELYLDRSKFFLSKNALVPLVYYAAKSKSQKKALDKKAMMKFFLVSQLGGHYSGAGETVLRRDLRYLSDPGVSAKEGLHQLLDIAVREAKRDYWGLKIKPIQVGGVPSKNVMVLLMYIVMRKRKAADFGLTHAQPLGQISDEKLQLHHIFPFDFMMNDGKALAYQKAEGLTSREYRNQVNDVANLTFLSSEENVRIGNLSPWQYLPNDTTEVTRKNHFIPEDKELWTPENFNDFLDSRRKLLSKAMNSLLRGLD
jgi:hypothetical protein